MTMTWYQREEEANIEHNAENGRRGKGNQIFFEMKLKYQIIKCKCDS